MRTLKRILLGLALLVLVAGAGLSFLIRRQLPGARTPVIAGLGASVSVALDGRAVPTLHAQSLEDAYRVQGYLVARERLFQMEVMRRTADGRLAELFGEAALPLDRLHRTYGFRQVAEQALALGTGPGRRSLEAYAAGVNAFITQHPGRWGLEFQLLVPDARPLPPDTEAFLREGIASARKVEEPRLGAWLAAAATLPVPAPESQLASNNWVVAGSRTRSGKPLLANDPHLGLSCPGIWFPLRLAWTSRFAQGVALPGLPGIVIGHNDRIAWGFTNLGTDLQDLFREPALERRQEWIPVKGRRPVEFLVASGKHGPQVVPGLSLHWPALDPRRLGMPAMDLLEAGDWATFNAAIDVHPGPPQNVVYADVDGHIGWRASGLIPIRRPGDDGSRIHDGTDPDQDWRGFVPPAAMSRLLDPAQGFLATANNRTIGTAFPQPVATAWASMSRAGRISAAGPGGPLGCLGLRRPAAGRRQSLPPGLHPGPRPHGGPAGLHGRGCTRFPVLHPGRAAPAGLPPQAPRKAAPGDGPGPEGLPPLRGGPLDAGSRPGHAGPVAGGRPG